MSIKIQAKQPTYANRNLNLLHAGDVKFNEDAQIEIESQEIADLVVAAYPWLSLVEPEEAPEPAKTPAPLKKQTKEDDFSKSEEDDNKLAPQTNEPTPLDALNAVNTDPELIKQRETNINFAEGKILDESQLMGGSEMPDDIQELNPEDFEDDGSKAIDETPEFSPEVQEPTIKVEDQLTEKQLKMVEAINGLTLAELQDQAKAFPKKEYKDMKKGELAEYLIAKITSK